MKKLIKNIFSSVLFTYKNIFHWIFSKILITISSYWIWILFALPFLIIAVAIISFSPLILSNFFVWGNVLLDDAMNNKIWFLLVLIFFVFSIVSLLLWISYKRFLLAKLNLKYIEWEKLEYKKNNYFNFKLFFKYSKINLIFLLVLLILSLFFWIIFFGIILLFWWLTEIQNILSSNQINLFSIISFILAIIYILTLIYFMYRIYFAYFILLENNDCSVIKSVKKSFNKTKSFYKLSKLAWILLIFFILFLPVNYLEQYINYNSNNLIDYISIKKKLSEEKTKKLVTQKEYYKYSALDIDFWKYSNKELIEKYNKNNIIELMFFVIYFLLIFWILDLVIANFYKKEIK